MSSFLLRSFCLYVVNVNSCQPHGCKKCFSIFKFGDLCHCCFYYVEFASAWRRLLGRSSMKLAVTMASCMYVWNFLNFGRCENSQKKKKKILWTIEALYGKTTSDFGNSFCLLFPIFPRIVQSNVNTLSFIHIFLPFALINHLMLRYFCILIYESVTTIR